MNKEEKQEIIQNTNQNMLMLNAMAKSNLFPQKELFTPIYTILDEYWYEYYLNRNTELLVELKSINNEIEAIIHKLNIDCIELFSELGEKLKSEKAFII